MGVGLARKPPVHKDPDMGDDRYANLVLVYRYPGMVPVVGAVPMGVQAVELLAPGCLGPGWSRSAPVVVAVTIGVQAVVLLAPGCLGPGRSPVWRPAVVPGRCLVLGLCLMGWYYLHPAMRPVPAPAMLPVW